MPRIRSILPLILIGACSSEPPPAVERLVLVQYAAPITHADSEVITLSGQSIALTIPLAKSMVIWSAKSIRDLQVLTGAGGVSDVDSLNQVVQVVVLFKAAPSDGDIARVLALARSTHVSGPDQYLPKAMETGFRLSEVNRLAAIFNIAELNFDYPPIVITEGASGATSRQ